MRQPSAGFKLVVGYCAFLALFVSADQTNAPAPAAESQFFERLIEAQLRWMEASSWLPMPDATELATRHAEHRVQIIKTLNSLSLEAADLANSVDTAPNVREQAAAIWWIYREGIDREQAAERLLTMLPGPESRSDLGHLLTVLAAGKTVEVERLRLLQQMPISRWLRSRLRSHILSPIMPSDADGPHAKAEKQFLGNVAFFVMLYLMFAITGLAIVLGWPYFKRRIPNRGETDPRPSPFAPEVWVGAYVVLAWFAFFVTTQLLISALFGNNWDGGSGVSIVALALQLGHGLFGLWVIGQLGMAGPREGIAGVVNHLRLGLEPLGGRITHALSWGFGGYAAAIPIVFIAAYVQALLPIQSHLVSNPILPLIADPPDVLTQLLLIVAVVGAAPFFEECLFRGFLFRQLRARMGVTAAVVISSALFAAVHFNMGTFLHLFALGAVLAIVTERSGALLPAMLVHGLWNGATILMTVSIFGG